MLYYDKYAKSCIRAYFVNITMHIDRTLNIFSKFDMQIASLVVGQPTPSPIMMCILAPDLGIGKGEEQGNMKIEYLKHRYNFKNAHDSAKRTLEANKRAMDIS